MTTPMFFHIPNETIFLQEILSIEWNFYVDNISSVDIVVNIMFKGGGETYLYYNDPQALDAIVRLKEVLKYPYSLPANFES